MELGHLAALQVLTLSDNQLRHATTACPIIYCAYHMCCSVAMICARRPSKGIRVTAGVEAQSRYRSLPPSFPASSSLFNLLCSLSRRLWFPSLVSWRLSLIVFLAPPSLLCLLPCSPRRRHCSLPAERRGPRVMWMGAG